MSFSKSAETSDYLYMLCRQSQDLKPVVAQNELVNKYIHLFLIQFVNCASCGDWIKLTR